MHLRSTLLLLAACRLDQGVTAKDNAELDTNPPILDDTGGGEDTGPAPSEECNGVDDDGDGEVDEGFPDDDANGRVDCLDDTCPPLLVGDAGPVEIDPACVPEPPVPEPWNLAERWRFTAPDGQTGWWSSVSAPVAAQLGDDDGDGDIDDDDDMDVLLATYTPQAGLVALDGATGAQHWWYPGTSIGAATAVIDLDLDGTPEVLTFDAAARLVCLDAEGNLLWTGPTTRNSVFAFSIAVADLDGDGRSEILADDMLVESDGTLRASLDVPMEDGYRTGVMGDADGDGQGEVYLSGRVFDTAGHLLWDSGVHGALGLHALLWQVDGDAQAEVVFIGDGEAHVFEPDGTPLWTAVVGTGRREGVPCLADFDGDGESELAVPDTDVLTLLDPDGSTRWSGNINDPSGLAGCAGADLDGDGAAEAIFADHTTLRIWDVRSDSAWPVSAGHASITNMEYPVVADLDGDGHAELLLVSSDERKVQPALRAFSHAGDGWAPAPGGWPSYSYQPDNLSASGVLGPLNTTSWTSPGYLRGRPAAEVATTDLTVAITDLCVADCTYGPAAVAVWVGNEGTVDVPAGVSVALWAVEAEGERLVATLTLPAVPAGTSLDGLEVALAVDEVGSLGLHVRVDDDGTGAGTVSECDEADNDARWGKNPCG